MAANNDWTREGLAWVAGLFEGEGCIALSRKTDGHDQWFLVIASTDLDVLERTRNLTGVGNITGPTRRGTNKPYWTWRVTKREHVYALLVALYPWLGSRRQDRAVECLKGISSNPHSFVGRKCKQGHRWSPDTVVKRHYGGRMRRVCMACLDQGVIEIRSEAS